jgi:hypothetical protein
MLRPSIKSFVFSAALLALPLVCLAQKPTAIPLVPAANWRQVNAEDLPVDAVRDHGGDPAIEQEYGVKQLELRTYELANTRVAVIVEPASDTSAAYGLFTIYQTESMTPEKGLQLVVSGSEEALMARGRNFIRFVRPKVAKVSDSEFRALLVFVGGTRPSAEALANMPPPLPAAGLVPGSEKYLLGLAAAKRVLPSFRTELLGFSQGAEVQVANYLSGKSRSTLIAVSYPTPQIARIRFGSLKDFLGINEERGSNPTFGRREGSFLFLVLNADNATTAAKLMDQVRVVQQVSSNVPYPGDKPFAVQVFELLIANFILIVILAGICVGGGLMVFVSRRVAAKYFPHLEWGHPGEESIIRLNLS